MKAEAPMRVADKRPRRFAVPTCPRCNDMLFAATASEHVSERHVRHVWSCDSCGHEFSTFVDLPLIAAAKARMAAA